jgi:hypothetical protein
MTKRLKPITARGKQIVAYVLTAAGLETCGDDCELETMAKKLGTTGGRLMPTLRKLEAAGWLGIDEGSLTFVYPTVAAIRRQSKHFSERQAAAIVRKLRRRV